MHCQPVGGGLLVAPPDDGRPLAINVTQASSSLLLVLPSVPLTTTRSVDHEQSAKWQQRQEACFLCNESPQQATRSEKWQHAFARAQHPAILENTCRGGLACSCRTCPALRAPLVLSGARSVICSLMLRLARRSISILSMALQKICLNPNSPQGCAPQQGRLWRT